MIFRIAGNSRTTRKYYFTVAVWKRRNDVRTDGGTRTRFYFISNREEYSTCVLRSRPRFSVRREKKSDVKTGKSRRNDYRVGIGNTRACKLVNWCRGRLEKLRISSEIYFIMRVRVWLHACRSRECDKIYRCALLQSTRWHPQFDQRFEFDSKRWNRTALI